MQESYDEGVASHTGPESCVAARKGRDEALTGVRAGRAIEPRNSGPVARRLLRGADAHSQVRKTTLPPSLSRDGWGPRAVEDPAHARKHPARESGEPGVACNRQRCRPHREVQGRTPMMHDARQSYSPIVPKKPPNNARNWLRRRGREGGWPRGTRPSVTRPGRSAGPTRPARSSGYGTPLAWPSRPKAGTGCGSSARPGLWRGRGATLVPTPTEELKRLVPTN